MGREGKGTHEGHGVLDLVRVVSDRGEDTDGDDFLRERGERKESVSIC